MRFTIAYYLMLLYVIVNVKPLIPIISDSWAHEFNELEHIAKYHAKYGSHHLEKELANTESNNNKSKDQNIPGSENQISFHVLPQSLNLGYSTNTKSNKYFLHILSKLTFVYISNQGPPPKTLV